MPLPSLDGWTACGGRSHLLLRARGSAPAKDLEVPRYSGGCGQQLEGRRAGPPGAAITTPVQPATPARHVHVRARSSGTPTHADHLRHSHSRTHAGTHPRTPTTPTTSTSTFTSTPAHTHTDARSLAARQPGQADKHTPLAHTHTTLQYQAGACKRIHACIAVVRASPSINIACSSIACRGLT